MNRKIITAAVAASVAAVVAAALMWQGRTPGDRQVASGARSSVTARPVTPQRATPAASAHVPAHYEQSPALADLAPTLEPKGFIGKVREAYAVAGKIPQTLAQMPCYCHCDESVGHKSLQSCFTDGHASSCAVCVEEALEVYKLQSQGLTAAQVRERIVAEYSAQ